jgi:hypothetical protein
VTEDSGLCRIRIQGYFDVPVRREWTDAPDRPIDQRLGEIVLALITASHRGRTRRLALEWRDQEWREAQEQRRILEERQIAIGSAVKRLEDEAAAWKRAQAIRDYVALAGNDESAERNPAEWRKWALLVADAIDPLVSETNEQTLFEVGLPIEGVE